MIERTLKQKKTLSIAKQMFIAFSLLAIVITPISAINVTEELVGDTSGFDASSSLNYDNEYWPQPFIPESVFVGSLNKFDNKSVFDRSNSSNRNITLPMGDVPSYCADFCEHDNPDFNYWLDTICIGPYCANDWKVYDIDNDGYSEHYLLVGDTYYQWGYAKAETSFEPYYVYDFDEWDLNEPYYYCTYDYDIDTRKSHDYCGDAREYTYLSKTLTGTANRLSSFACFAHIYGPSEFHGWWGWWSWDLSWTWPDDHTEYAMVLECGVDADCLGGQVCCKPTLSDPTSYYCAAQLSTPTLSAPSDACADTSYTVSWNSVSGATSYKLYENGNNVYDGSELSQQFSHPSGSYTYYVQACNDCGCSGNSNSKNRADKTKTLCTNIECSERCLCRHIVHGKLE